MITFSSDAFENIIYFTDIAQNLLTLMGHSGTVPGAFKAQEVPLALFNLQNGLAEYRRNIINSSSQDHDDENEPQIGLGVRAIPLINMLEAAIKKQCDVMWS